MPYSTVIKSVSLSRELVIYALDIAARETVAHRRKVSFSEVVAWGLRALKTIRHDVPGKAMVVDLAAEALARKAMRPREVVAELKTVAKELEALRDDAVGASGPGVDTPGARTSASTARAAAPGAGRRGAG